MPWLRVCSMARKLYTKSIMTTAYQMNLGIKVPGKRWHEALSLLRPLVESTRILPECISSVLHQDQEDSGSLWLIEEWASEESLMRHVKSGAFRMIFEAMELSVDAPVLRFRMFQEMGGLDMVQQVRHSERN